MTSIFDKRAGPSRPLHVLIVDSSSDMLETITMIVEFCGFTTKGVHTGTEALAHAMHFATDIVITSMRLHDFPGYKLARQLRDNTAGPRPILVLLTGESVSILPEQKKSPFDFVLQKPVDVATLKGLLECCWPLEEAVTPRQHIVCR